MKVAKLPSWNLRDLYSSLKDPRIGKTLTLSLKRAQLFEKRYRDQLIPKPVVVLKAIREFEAITLEASKPYHYATLLFADSSTVTGRGAFLQYVKGEYLHIHNHLIFFEHEFFRFSKKELERLIKNEALSHYHHFLKNILRIKPHRLSVEVETILSDKSLSGAGAWIRFFDEELSVKKFPFRKGKKTEEVSEALILSKLYSPDRADRRAGAEGLSVGLKEEARRLTYVFNTLALDKSIDDTHRKFLSPESARHLANEIDQETVTIMASIVTEHYGCVQDFYRLKKKILKVPELFDYDRYAPVGFRQEKIPFPVAKRYVLDSFYGFSQEYGKIAEQFFKKGWIDAAHREGKRNGAFCSFVTPDLHPYVFMNYNGTMREVFTLAHELGHAIHAWFMREQSYLNFDTPLTIAETASVFAEMLLYERLKGELKGKEELFALSVGKIESIFATVFRQIAMYRFEQDLHSARRKGGELSTQDINRLWRKRQSEMFGTSVTLTADYDYWWSYIPHFIHTPFYVYAYAFGELLTLALYGRYREQGASFVPIYIELLRSGGSKSPDELLKPFGVDLRSPAFWKQGVGVIRGIVKEVTG